MLFITRHQYLGRKTQRCRENRAVPRCRRGSREMMETWPLRHFPRTSLPTLMISGQGAHHNHSGAWRSQLHTPGRWGLDRHTMEPLRQLEVSRRCENHAVSTLASRSAAFQGQRVLPVNISCEFALPKLPRKNTMRNYVSKSRVERWGRGLQSV